MISKEDIVKGIFLKRLNRFVGEVNVGGESIKVHISDTGRLKEILTEGRQVYFQKLKGKKTEGRLLGAKMEDGVVLLNTALHPYIAKGIIKDRIFYGRKVDLKAEVVYKDSRLDFMVDGKFLIEVKSCNLLQDEVCLFPDAPTFRGVKHLRHLVQSIEEGYSPILLILAFRECKCFFPNFHTDKLFYQTFKHAVDRGVDVRIFKVKVEEDFCISVKEEIGICEERWFLQKISSIL